MKRVSKLVLVLFTLSLFQGLFLLHPGELESATLTGAKDLIQNSRLSFSGALEGAHNVSDTLITIDTTNYPDNDNHHLFPGDTAHIGSNNYTIGTVIDDATDNKFTITSGLQSGDTADDTKIYVYQTPIHTITFTTAFPVADGAIRVSIPATANDTNDSDGNPDADGFDLNSIDVTGPSDDVSCPDATGFDFATDAHTATDAGGGGWHTFECRYSGNGSSSTALTMTIGSTNKLLNAAANSTHTEGVADAYTIKIQNLNSGDDIIDSITAKVVLVEAVHVTATVEASLSFTIAGRNSGDTHCGEAADITTAVYSVPFGSLSTANSFVDGAQKLSVSTNADDGYHITVFEDDELGLDGADSPYIADTACNAACNHTTSAEWNTNTNNGFGYSLENVGADTDARFLYNESSRTFSAKHFPNRTEGATQDQDANADVMYNTGPVSDNSAYVCYRISISGTQQAGDYYNTITYIATPTF